jgi:hypothetical protein
MNDIYCKLDLSTNTLQAAAAVYNHWVSGAAEPEDRRQEE